MLFINVLRFAKNICWYHQFEETGCLCKGKSLGPGKSTAMPVYKRKCLKFCNDLLTDMEEKKSLPWLFLSDEATFYVSNKFNCHNMHIWGFQNPHEIEEHE